MADVAPALPAVPGSLPFVHNVDSAPAYWWLDILWVILVKGEDTGGRYSLMYEALPKGSRIGETGAIVPPRPRFRPRGPGPGVQAPTSGSGRERRRPPRPRR